MNKIAVVLSCNLHWAPYYTRYEKMLSKSNQKFDLILWNRENIREKVSLNANLIEFSLEDETNNGNVKKIVKFLKFAQFVKKQLIKNQYSKVIFLGTYAFMPALLHGYLKRKYNNRYWVDLRDITYEHNSLFYVLERDVFSSAYNVVISSKGFLPHLPAYDYGYIHNIDPSMDEIYKSFKKTDSDKIRISYIGNIAYWDSVFKVVDTFANDERFLLTFAGPNSEKVKEYCKQKQIENVQFFGRFSRMDTVLFYNNTDIIYNVYGNDYTNVQTACSNKLYYAMKFHMPLLVSDHTYMEDICQKYNMGFTFEHSKDFPDKLYQMYLDFASQKHLFDEALQEACAEDQACTTAFEEFINGK